MPMKMHKDIKPIKKCGKCPMNLGKRCWVCISPRDEWRDGRECSATTDVTVLKKFKAWRLNPKVPRQIDLRKAYLNNKPATITVGKPGQRR
jgi:hypothetical protein